MMTSKLTTQLVREQFDCIANAYDAHAVVYKEVASRLVGKLDFIKIVPHAMMDLGAGTGYLMCELSKRFPDSMGVEVDLSFEMLKQKGGSNKVQADSLFLPFSDNSVELVMSNLMLPWCENLDGIFNEVMRVLKPGGLFLFSSFGPDTFKECLKSHFLDMHDVGDLLLHTSFSDPVMDVEKITVYYAHLDSLLADLNNTASVCLTQQGWLTPNQQSDKYPLTFEIVYGHAWKTQQPKNKSEDGEFYFPLSQLGSKKHS